LRDEENLCSNAKFTGFHFHGGFAEYCAAPEDFVLPIPDSITDDIAAPLLCAGIIGYRSLRSADLLPGETLGLIGFGASAHLAIQVARYWDCRVMVFTRSEAHRKHARELGAEWVGGIEDEIPDYLDRAIIFAPAGDLVPLALRKIRPGGTLAINAIVMSQIPAIDYSLLYGERTLRSVTNATRQDGHEFLSLVEKAAIRSAVQIFPLRDANKALQEQKASRIKGEAVLSTGE
jgi:propanol-preferring alcohol dehydrogenase